MSDTKKLEKHLFICTNTKEGKECCALKNGAKLRDDLKALCKNDPRLKGHAIRINASGCLGHCAEGITAVLYPEGKWFTSLTENDAKKLLEEIVSK